ncbi:MAG: PspC domain-containing protein [Chlamydiae bacterium]|jgi:phage shock protein PspC (stress-responsive transcriptional regulator)|nr:PspC domain-containing protein [Chlamydiota bacterium]
MKRVYKDRFDKKIAGVCGGLAQYFQIDASLIRLLFIFLTLVTGGIFLLIYILLCAILPTGPKSYVEAKYKKLYRSKTDKRFGGVCGGLGKYFRIDSNIIRLIFIVLLFITGFFPMVIIYMIAIGVIPEEI